MRQDRLVRKTLDRALAAVAERGVGGLGRSHRRVACAIDPLAVELEVLRLGLHTATAGAGDDADAMTDAAALCDDARGHLDELRRLVGRVAGAAGIADAGASTGRGSAA